MDTATETKAAEANAADTSALDNGRITLSPADLGAMLARMPQPAAEQARTALGEVVTDTGTLAAVNIAQAKASEAAGLEPRAAHFEPMAFDFDADASEPDWLIGGLIERCTVNVQSGDTGAAKSIHWQDAAVRLVHGESWLGRATGEARKVLYVDEENPERVTRSRLKALGATNDDRDQLRYYRRAGIRVGDPVATRWLHEECEAFAPDVVIIDTAMAATTAEVNDNDSVVLLFTETLRPVAERHGLAIVVLHHERKPAAGEARNAGFAMMGARQWAGQADVHMTLATYGGYTATPLDAGEQTERAFTFSVAKARDGYSTADERTVVRGVKLARDGQTTGEWPLVALRVEWEGKVTAGTAEGELADSILRAMAGDAREQWAARDGAEAVARKATDGTFKRAWKSLCEGAKPALDTTGNGPARKASLTEHGRDRADALGLDV